MQKNKYIVSFKEIIEYSPLEIEAWTEDKAIEIYRKFYSKGLIGRSISPSIQISAELVRTEIEPNNVPPLMRNEDGKVKPIEG